ncbi:MAG TPA: hypothetical protein VFN23_07075 [Ktedonobacteraceae bacterium]|nr:hypothetical protein [Ktedonobacteraceae bacterium]
MYTVINFVDRTDSISPDSEDNGAGSGSAIQVNASLSDPNTTWDFALDDPQQQIKLQNFMPVIVFDENAPAIGGVSTIPTMNFALNVLLNNSGSLWTPTGTLAGLVTWVPFHMQMTFNNNALGTGLAQQQTLLGYVQPGVQYMWSMYLDGVGTISNIQGVLQMSFLDAFGNALGLPITGTWTPISGGEQRQHIMGVAPANAAYAIIAFGGQTTVGGANSGTLKWGTPLFEPMWFASKGINYPTPDCNVNQVNSVLMPDGTTSRGCRRFAGYIEDLVVTYAGKQRHYAVQCASSSKLLETAGLISASYTDTQDTSIITNALSLLPANSSIIGQLATGSQHLFAPSSTLIPGVIVPSISWNNATLRQVLNDLGAQSGSLYYVDPYYYLWYVPPSFAGATVMLSDTPDNIISFPYAKFSIEYDSTNPVNTALVVGSKQNAAAVTDTFSGNGSTTVFSLTEPPYTVTVVTIGGTSQRCGVDGVDNAKFGPSLTFKALINKQNQTITFATAPASGTNNVVVTYTYEDQVVSQVIAADAIAQQKNQFWGLVKDSAITSTTAAKNRGIAELQEYAFPRVILTLDALNIYLPVGSLILFTCQSEGLSNAPFIVQTVQSDLQGGGVDNWSYTAGVYNPTIIDHLRNVTKAIQKTPTTANVAVVASIDVALFDDIHLNDSIVVNNNGAPGQPPYLYGAANQQDTFTRANQSGWSPASDGETWFQVAGTDTLSISSNEGVVTSNASTASNRLLLGVGSITDAEGLCRIIIGDTSGDSAGILLRSDSTGANHYLARYTPGSTTTLSIDKRIAGTLSNLLTPAAGFTYAAGSHLWIRFRVQGTTLYIRAWLDGSSEPATWNGSVTDSSLASGRSGLYASGNPTTGPQFDSFSVTSLVAGAVYGFASYA